MKIKAALSADDGQTFQLEELDLREPNADELLVKIAACGVCHTDLSMMGGDGGMVYGHEACGVVEQAGKNAAGFSEGDRVVLSYPHCGVCPACRQGRPYSCVYFSDLFMGERLSGPPPLTLRGRRVLSFFGQGGFATHTVAHQSSAVKVHKELDLKMLGPLGCGVQTGAGSVMNVLRPEPGAALAVFGTGSVGLSSVLAAKALGCGTIIAVDRVRQRLELAEEFGATHTVHTGKTTDAAGEIIAISGGLDFVVDTSGSAALMDAAARCLKPGGRGCGVAAAGLPRLGREDGRRWDEVIQGSSVPREFIPKMIELYRQGRFPYDKMLSYFEFEQIGEAFRQMKNAEIIKPVLVM